MTELRQSVLRHAQKAYACGLMAGTSGNLSVRCPNRGLVAITASGVRYETMTPADIVTLDLASGRPAGETDGRRPSSETPLHLAIYRARPDVCAIVHTHSPYATAFAAGAEPIPCALIEMVYHLGGAVAVAPLALPGTDAVGLGALSALGGGYACLLQNHGAVAIGHDIETAFLRAEYVEEAAKICLLARQNGRLVPIDEATIARMLGHR